MINCFKLVTGEDIIAEAEVFGSQGIVRLKKPAQIGMMQVAPDKYGIALIPFLPFAKTKEFKLRLQDIVMEFEPSADLYNQYTSMVGGLVIPDNKVVLNESTLPEPPAPGGRPNLQIVRD